MSRLTVRLPESLHQQLHQRAHQEGVSLNQYVVYALTRQTTIAYAVAQLSGDAVEQQHADFEDLLLRLGTATPDEVREVLNGRDAVEAEPELAAEVSRKLQDRVARRKA